MQIFSKRQCETERSLEMDGKEMSEYERDRLKRIEENRKMLDELFPDGTSLNVSVPSSTRSGKELTPEAGMEEGSTYGSPAERRVRTR